MSSPFLVLHYHPFPFCYLRPELVIRKANHQKCFLNGDKHGILEYGTVTSTPHVAVPTILTYVLDGDLLDDVHSITRFIQVIYTMRHHELSHLMITIIIVLPCSLLFFFFFLLTTCIR